MKIAMVFDGLGTGGIERVGINYCKILLELGHTVDIYNLMPNKTDMEGLYPKDVIIYHKKLTCMQTPDQYFLLVKRWWWGKYVYPIIYLLFTIWLYLYRITMCKRKKYDISIAFSGHFTDLNFVTKEFIKSKKKIAWLHGALMEYLTIAVNYGDQYRKIKNLIVLSENSQKAALSFNTQLNEIKNTPII